MWQAFGWSGKGSGGACLCLHSQKSVERMSVLLIALGIFLIAFVFLDVLWTALGIGGGPFTRRFTSLLWRGVLQLYERTTLGHRFLVVTGVSVFLLAIGVWILGLWAGCFLLFSGIEGAVVHAQTGLPAGFWERVYFSGFTVFTLGTGDYVPQGALWQALTPLAALSGLFLVTLSITYLVPVVQAATHKRQLALRISSLGVSAQDIVLNAWDGTDCKGLQQPLPSLAGELAMLGQQHLTYPVLHYFHSPAHPKAIAPSVVALDEALTILRYGLPERCGLDPPMFRLVRQVITEFLGTLEVTFIEEGRGAPPPPSLDRLREEGLPVTSDEAFREAVRDLAHRRRLLLGLVRSDGWGWEALKEREASSPERSLTRGPRAREEPEHG